MLSDKGGEFMWCRIGKNDDKKKLEREEQLKKKG